MFYSPQECRYLQNDAALDEIIESNLAPSLSVKLSNENVVKLVREPVPWKRESEIKEGQENSHASPKGPLNSSDSSIFPLVPALPWPRAGWRDWGTRTCR